MTLEIGTRRGFLVGALALMTAPAIVHADSIMRVVPIDMYDTRCLIAYDIRSDQLMLRVDRCLNTMVRPNRHVQLISTELAKKLMPFPDAFTMRPAAGVQRHVDMMLLPQHAAMLREAGVWV